MPSTKIDLSAVTLKVAAALDENRKAKPYNPETNSYSRYDETRMINGVGIIKGADRSPAKRMSVASSIAATMEETIIQAHKDGAADRSQRRKAAARARAQRKAQFDRIAATPMKIDPERLTAAWSVVFPLVPIITRIATTKRQWASRFLGSVADDIPQMALEKTALVLAKGDRDLDLLRRAADELGGIAQRSGKTPGDQATDEERTERKEMAKARKWLMGLVNNRVMGALVDTYTDVHNLRWDNIDTIATVMASISGVGEDPLVASTKADRAPAMLGTRFPRPGGFDPNLLAQAISAAITAHGQDRLVELLLDDDNRRTDGSVKWTECAEAIFMAVPGGPWKWTAVCEVAAQHKMPRKTLAKAARMLVRNEFAWLPAFIVSAVGCFDQKAVRRVSYRGMSVAIMSSAIEGFLVREIDAERGAEARKPMLRPALTFSTPEQAAIALLSHLSVLTTGSDYATSIAFA